MRPAERVPPGEAARRVIVHVGAHKTGSTTLQFLLRHATDELARRSVFHDRASYALGGVLRDAAPLPAGELARARDELAARLDACGARTAVLSSESFFGDPFDGYARGAHVAADLAGLLEGRDVTVVALVRRQDTFLSSIWQQHVKEGGTRPWDAFRAALPPDVFDWDARLAAFDAAFGRERVRVLAYETAFDAGERVLGRVLGPEVDIAVASVPRRNPSLSAEGLRLLAAANELLSDAGRGKLRRFLQEEFARGPDEPDPLLADGVGAAILAGYRAANERLFASRLRDDAARAEYIGT